MRHKKIAKVLFFFLSGYLGDYYTIFTEKNKINMCSCLFHIAQVFAFLFIYFNYTIFQEGYTSGYAASLPSGPL